MLRSKKGFTLVEISVILIIIGIVAAFMLPSLTGVSEQSAEVVAIEHAKSLITEYRTNNSTDHVEELVIIYDSDSSFRVFGYNYNEKILYMFTGANWLRTCSTEAAEQGFDHVVYNMINSADPDPLLGGEPIYAQATGLFTLPEASSLSYSHSEDAWTGALNAKFPEKTQKSLKGNTIIFEAAIADVFQEGVEGIYKTTENGVDYYVRYAEPELIGNSVTGVYETVFEDDDGTMLYNFSTTEETSFTAPNDPPSSTDRYFKYWMLTSVDGEEMNIPATALAAGESYDVPNSDVVYTAVYSDTTVPEKDGDTYLICNRQELSWFADHVNGGATAANAKLMRSFNINNELYDDEGKLLVDLIEFKPIGTSAEPYTGTFDGDGYAISGMLVKATESVKTRRAMFGYAQGATIKDLTIKASYFSGERYVAALIGDTTQAPAEGETPVNTTVSGCSIQDVMVVAANVDAGTLYIETTTDNGDGTFTVTPEGGTYCGGLVGMGMYLDITDCVTDGTVNGGNGGSAIGGFIGAANGKVTISDSHNTARVTGARYVGGIIGKVQRPAETTLTTTVSRCYNNAAVVRSNTLVAFNAEGALETDPGYITLADEDYFIAYGGIIGGTTSKAVVEDCFNDETGKISVPMLSEEGETLRKATGMGGIVGLTGAAAASSEYNNNRNLGTVIGINSTGGIVGEVRKAAITLSGCTNEGTVEAGNISGGGIIGRIRDIESGETVVTGCSTKAASSVTGNRRIGGIIGDCGAAASITACTNAGSVTETAVTNTYQQGVGGIVGSTVGRITVSECKNTGAVTGFAQGAGGIIGKATTRTLTDAEGVQTVLSADGTHIEKCENTGTVTTAQYDPEEATPVAENRLRMYTGGIMGFGDTVVTIDYCVNTGYVSGVNHVGGIAGTVLIPVAEPADPETDPETDPEEPVEPEVPSDPIPEKSSINNCYNVGVVEATEADAANYINGVAGAVLGNTAYAVGAVNNYYLKNCVIVPEAAAAYIADGYTDAADETLNVIFGTEKTKTAFESEEATGVTALLNAGLAEGEEIFTLPEFILDEEGNPTEDRIAYKYKKDLTDRVDEFNETAEENDRITLPEWLPTL